MIMHLIVNGVWVYYKSWLGLRLNDVYYLPE